MSSKTIALAIERFDRHHGGAESYAVGLAESLVSSGWEVHLFGHDWDGQPTSAEFHRIPEYRWLPSWMKLIWFAQWHRHLVRKMDFDVILGFGNTVHMNVYQSHGGVHRISTAKKLYSQTNPLFRVAKRLTIPLSIKYWTRDRIESTPFRMDPRPKIIAIADMIKNDMLETYGGEAGSIEVIYNGIEPYRFGPKRLTSLKGRVRGRLGIGEDETVFLFISFDLKKKGLAVLIKAMARLKKKSPDLKVRVLVVGGEPNRGLEGMIRRRKLENTIIFTGPTKTPEQFYADSDAFILPTYYDACSLVVLEAMAAGLPTVTTTANGVSGLIKPGVNGHLIDHPPKPAQLADCLAKMMDRGARLKMAQAAKLTVKNQTMKASHERMIEIFEGMVGE